MKRKAVAAGLSDAAIERFPADGKTKYAHFLSHVGWTPVSATLEEVEPRQRLIASFPDLPVALADYSQDANVTAALVDVGKGTSPADYEGKDVRGKIVLADGPLPTVHRLACEERGAAGFLSDFPNQATPWSGDDRDLIRWGHLSPYQPKNRFAFMISKRQAAELRERLASGERVVLRARVDAKMVPATYDVVVATIPGTDPSAGEVVVTAHLCHESAGANDNASGSAAILEVARALAAAIRRQTLAPPRRTIRFLWLPEITGSQAYLVRHPEVVARLVGGVHMDMVGGLLATTKGTFHVSRTAETLPHVANVVAEAWFDQVVAASQRYAEGMNPTGYAEGTGDAYAGFVWPPGSREMLLGDVRGINMGSDHEVFQAGGFRVPMVYFHDYPDITIHTQKDQPENLDATKLGRVAYLGAGVVYTLAALPDAEVPRLLALARVDGEERILRAGLVTGPDAAVTRREAIRSAIGTLESVAKLWPSAAPAVAADVQRLRAELPPARRARRPPGSDPQPGHRRPHQRLLLRLLRRHPGGRLHEDGARAARRRRHPRLRGAEPRRRDALGLGDPRRPLRPLRARPPRRHRGVLRASRASRSRLPAVRVAQIASICFSIPPRAHGGTEIAIDLLTRGLVARGHDVTLFASGDSRTTAKLHAVVPRATQDDPDSTSYIEREMEVRNASEAYGLAGRFDLLHSHWPTPAAYFSTTTERPSVMTYAYIERALHEYYRAHFPRLHPVCVTEAQNRMLGGNLPVIRYGIDVARVPFSATAGDYLVTVGRLVPHKGADRAIAIAERAGLPLVIVGGVTPYLEDSEPFYEERVRPKVDGVRVRHFASLPNDEVLAPHGRSARLRLPHLLGGALRARRGRGARGRDARRRDAARLSARAGRARRDGFLAESDEELAAFVGRVKELDRSACRRAAEERFSAERMVSEYEAFYRKILSG